MLWLLQIGFLGSFYKGMKERRVINIANTITSEYGKSNFEDTIKQLAFKNSIFIFITDNSGRILYSFDEHKSSDSNQLRENGQGQTLMGEIFGLIPRNYNEFLNKLNSSNKKYITYTTKQDRFVGETLVHGRQLDDAILYISTPIETVNATTQILQTQLIYVTIIASILSFLIAFFIARKLSKPISKINESAKELAKRQL